MAASSHGFSAASLEKKLRDLNSTLQSIQGTAQWLIHHRKNAKSIVSFWYKEVQKVESNRKLTLLYLANDVIQNSKKKGLEYKMEFIKVLPRTFQMISHEKDDHGLCTSVERIISVWEERKVFENDVIIRFKSMLVAGTLKPHRRTRSESDMKRSSLPNSKRSKLERRQDSVDEPPNNRKPPEPEDFLRRIQTLQSIDSDGCAGRDMATRQKIASFPPEIHDPSLLSQVKDKAAAETLAKRVDEAAILLKDYNKRLELELQERKEFQELLDAFIWQQRSLLKSAKKTLMEYQDKMEKVTLVKEELKSHLANLPDFSQLPIQGSKKGSLAPLPTVGDLFN